MGRDRPYESVGEMVEANLWTPLCRSLPLKTKKALRDMAARATIHVLNGLITGYE